MEESIANTRNVMANFLNFEKMKMASALLTEFAEEHKKYLDCNSRFYTKGLPTPSMCAVLPTFVLGPDSQSLPLKLAIFTPSTWNIQITFSIELNGNDLLSGWYIFLE